MEGLSFSLSITKRCNQSIEELLGKLGWHCLLNLFRISAKALIKYLKLSIRVSNNKLGVLARHKHRPIFDYFASSPHSSLSQTE